MSLRTAIVLGALAAGILIAATIRLVFFFA